MPLNIINHSLRSIDALRSYAALIGLTLSLCLIFQSGALNRDGMLYDETANIFIQHGLEAASANYNWPFLSIMAATISQLTQLSTTASLHLIITISFLFIADFFIRVNYLYSSDIKRAAIAAGLILSIPAINSYRDMVIRDPGAWACMLGAIYYSSLYFLTNKRLSVLLASVSLVLLAGMFRVEFLTFIIALPIIALVQYFRRKSNNINSLAGVVVAAIAFTTAILALVYRHPEYKLATQLSSIFNITNFLAETHRNSDIIASQILNKFSAKNAAMFYFSGLIGSFFAIIALSMQPAFSLIALLKLKLYIKLLLNNRLLIMLIALMLIPLFLQYLTSQVLVSRYLGFLAILLLFPLVAVVHTVTDSGSRLKYLLAAIVLVSFLDNIIPSKPNDKSYLRTSGEWIQQHHPDSTIGGNDKQAIYLATGVYKKAKVSNLEKSQDDFFILIAKTAASHKRWTLIKTIDTDAKRSAYIYQQN